MKKLLLLFFCLTLALTLTSQTLFRSGIFLHHSTGANIWGPNGSNTSVPLEMVKYNTSHSYSGSTAVSMIEEWWSPDDNEWSTQHDFFEDPSSTTGIGHYLGSNKIIVIKSCYPSSEIYDAGQPSDTASPTDKTIYNYKWHWRHIIRVMASHPENFFVIWTNAPLEPGSTNASEAAYSRWFCKWAKDTLEAGLDTEFGAFPDNVYVFDFFSKLTGTDGIMLNQYRAGNGDSHPNASATELVAPQFVTEIFDAAIAYESIYSGIKNPVTGLFSVKLLNNFRGKNPEISVISTADFTARIDLFSLEGKMVSELYYGKILYGENHIIVPENLTSGTYLIVIHSGEMTETKKIIFTE